MVELSCHTWKWRVHDNNSRLIDSTGLPTASLWNGNNSLAFKESNFEGSHK